MDSCDLEELERSRLCLKEGRDMWLFFCAIILIFISAPFKAEAAEVIKMGEVLSLRQCTEIALKNHTAIVAAMNTVNVNRSRMYQAEANYYPQLDLLSGYRKYLPPSEAIDRSPPPPVDEYSGSARLSQNIYDFGRTTAQVDIQRLNVDSSQSDLENAAEQIIFNVRQSYYEVLKAKRNRDVAMETVRLFEQYLEQAKGFYEVGKAPKFDVTKAEVDLSNARLDLIRAENAVRIARVNLNNAMGVPDAPGYEIEDTLSFQQYEISFEDAIRQANEDRPDLKSVTAKRESAASAIELAKKGYYPALSGNAEYSRSGEEFPLKDGWSIGAALTFPVFNGFMTRYQVEEAEANLNVLRANEETLRQAILLEVQQAYLNLQEAGERISTSEIAVKQAEENLDLARGRYAAGVGNPIEITDALVAYSNAKTDYVDALYDFKVARASLEKAMGAGSMGF